MNLFSGKVNELGRPLVLAIAIAMIVGSASTVRLHAQALGWEGETGVFVTPLAYTANVEKQKVHPVIAYHYLNAGSVIGDFHEGSITVGFFQRFELGYTHEFHVQGNDETLSPLWQNGFEIFHGKAMLVPENLHQENWIPAISVGFMARTDVRNVGNLVFAPGGGISATNIGKSNGDIYMVASKQVKQIPLIPVLFSAGVRGTNAVLWGMGGNAPEWKARAFGSVALPFKLPGGHSLIFASEVAQQPHHPVNFPNLNIPTTLTYAARFIPAKYHFNLDVGVAQIAGRVQPGVDLKARHQIGVQISYAF
ncbi:MAG TPA: hypothetical protein VMU05_18320 [Dongiaceae bacterium]|nr:hypothetical protein [Dongiaceae bacterium]